MLRRNKSTANLNWLYIIILYTLYIGFGAPYIQLLNNIFDYGKQGARYNILYFYTSIYSWLWLRR